MTVQKLLSRPDCYRIWCNEYDLRYLRLILDDALSLSRSPKILDLIGKIDSVL